MEMVEKNIADYKKKLFFDNEPLIPAIVTTQIKKKVRKRRNKGRCRKAGIKKEVVPNFKQYQKSCATTSLLIYNQKQVIGGIFHFQTKKTTDILLQGPKDYNNLLFVYRTKVHMKIGNVPVKRLRKKIQKMKKTFQNRKEKKFKKRRSTIKKIQ